MSCNGYCPFKGRCTVLCEWYNHASERCIMQTVSFHLGSISASLEEICDRIAEGEERSDKDDRN